MYAFKILTYKLLIFIELYCIIYCVFYIIGDLMVEDSITKFINTVPFFKDFTDVEKEKLISRADCFEKYNKEEVVFQQGDPGDTLFLVLQGKIGLFRLGTIDVDEGRVSMKEEAEKKITSIEPWGNLWRDFYAY